jgi:hypothetical protein
MNADEKSASSDPRSSASIRGSLSSSVENFFSAPRASPIAHRRAPFHPRRRGQPRRRAHQTARRKFPPQRKKALTRIFPTTKLAHEKGGDASAMAKKKKSSKKTTKKTTKKK